MMSTSEERLKILNMIAEGKITAEEGSKLLQALQEAKASSTSPDAMMSEGTARFLRVRVSDMATGKVKVNVSLPIGLVNVGMRMGARFVPDLDEIDVEDLLANIHQGARGKIVEVEDEEDGEKVEVYVE